MERAGPPSGDDLYQKHGRETEGAPPGRAGGSARTQQISQIVKEQRSRSLWDAATLQEVLGRGREGTDKPRKTVKSTTKNRCFTLRLREALQSYGGGGEVGSIGKAGKRRRKHTSHRGPRKTSTIDFSSLWE